VRVALAQRGQLRSPDAVAVGEPIDTRPYGYAPRYDYRQPVYGSYGYRPAPANYPPSNYPPSNYPPSNYPPPNYPPPYSGYPYRPQGY